MAIQYYMRGYNAAAPGSVGYVDWVVNDAPDGYATYVPAPYISSNITNITVNKTVTSKVDNFLKPFESLTAIGGTGYDGYFFHLNSYDWLHATPPGPPISVPSYLTGLSVVRGTVDGITPRDYATLFWAENDLKWLFAYNTNGDGYTIGSALPVGMGNLSIDGYLEVGTNPAQSGIIRLPNNQFIVSRNATNTGDGYLIGQDNLNRLRLGSPPGNQVYIPGNLRIDGYIRDGGTNPALSGFIRNSNNTSIAAFRNAANTNDITALSSTAGNLIVLGDAINSGLRFNTATGFEHIFQVNSTNLLRVGNIGSITYANFENSAVNPIISQFDASVGNGQNLIFKSQDTTSVGGIGGSAIISSGHGLLSDGYVDLRVNNIPKIRVFGATVPVTADLPDNSGSNPNSIQVISPTIRWYDTISNPLITQDPIATNSATGQLMTVKAQNATGSTSTGGALNLTSGTGTSTSGLVKIQTGGVDQIIVSPTNLPPFSFPSSTGKVIITGNLEVLGTTTTIDSTVVDIIGRVIHSNWTDPSVSPNVAVPSQVTGYTIHRGNASGVPRDSAALIWTEGLLNSGADGYWRATTYIGDGYGTDGYTISTGGVNSLAIMANNFTASATPNPSVVSLPGVGGLRTQNNTTAVSARNAAGTLDLLLLGSDSSNHVIMGASTSPTNAGFIFNTTTSSIYDFQINSVSQVQLRGDTDATDSFIKTITIAPTVVAPKIYQVAQSGTGTNAGVNMMLQAQNGQNQTGVTTNNNGGLLILASGIAGTGGTGAAGFDGYIDIRAGATSKLIVYPTLSTVAANNNSILFFENKLRIDSTQVTPLIRHDDKTTNGATGETFTIQSQNATGTTSTGGTLALTSGTGTSSEGLITFNTGNTNRLTLSGSTLTYSSSITFPTINQATTASASGQTMTFAAQNASTTGGSLIIKSGTGGTSAGNITLQNGSNISLVIQPTFTTFNGNAGAEALRITPNSAGATTIQAAINVTSFTINQANNTTASATATTLTVQAANATGTTATGGNLNLTSGTGTSNNGILNLQAGSVTTASIITNKFVFNKGRRRNINIVTTTITVPDGYDYIAIDASSVYTISLPATPTLGDTYEFKDINGTSATNNITIAGNGKNIDGLSTLVININFASLIVTYTGVQWSIN